MSATEGEMSVPTAHDSMIPNLNHNILYINHLHFF